MTIKSIPKVFAMASNELEMQEDARFKLDCFTYADFMRQSIAGLDYLAEIEGRRESLCVCRADGSVEDISIASLLQSEARGNTKEPKHIYLNGKTVSTLEKLQKHPLLPHQSLIGRVAARFMTRLVQEAEKGGEFFRDGGRAVTQPVLFAALLPLGTKYVTAYPDAALK